MKHFKRTTAAPLAVGAFILAILGGILFSLHGIVGMEQSAQHVSVSCLFVLAVVLHTALNWKQFT
ncbi:MAG: hypothetical protein WCH05_09220 [Chlorobiaceae bacterium]